MTPNTTDEQSIGKHFDEHKRVCEQSRDLLQPQIMLLFTKAHHTLAAGRKLLFFGNGGSAADAQHLATELTVRYATDRQPMAALALTTDSSALTAIGNDLGFDHIFDRQLRALARNGDLAIAITTSGNSANVINGLKTARELGVTTAVMTGYNGSVKVKPLADILIAVPSNVTARIQEMHILAGHILCDLLEQSVPDRSRVTSG